MMTHGVSFWRRSFPSLVLISLVASLLGACGTSSSGVTIATVTPLPTATATPVPCTAWRIIPSPNPAQYQFTFLFGVSAAAPADVWAVGGYVASDGTTRPLLFHWDGTAWRVVSSPAADYLRGVVAISPSDVWVVGGGAEIPSLTAHWNGSQWSVVPSNTTSHLDGVAALATNDVWAVGTVEVSPGTLRPLMDHWNGTAWQATTGSIPAGETDGDLAAVTGIPGTHQFWAAGWASAPPPPSPVVGPPIDQALIEQWDGTAWHLVAIPALPAGAVESRLSGVVALSPTDAWAVGWYDTRQNGPQLPLILHWNGTTWQVASSPTVGGALEAVAAAGTRDVRAVGRQGGSVHGAPALIEQWDGTAWEVVTSPTVGGGATDHLSGVTADSEGSFWAVGYSAIPPAGSSQPSTQKTLIVRCP
jgi:hypothetical protein